MMTSRVLVVGAGAMGNVAAQTAYLLAETASVTIADINLAQAEALAAALGNRASAVSVDIRDPGALDAAIAGHDIVLNATGPFYALGPVVLESAIRAGVCYADICDDWEPTLDMLALAGAAQQSGTVALIGMGASPGITNMLAVRAARELDTVDEIITGWSIDGVGDDDIAVPDSAPPSAALVHWLQQLTGTIRVQADGKLVDGLPLQQRQLLYPDFGDLSVWSVGHPEAVTLPRAFAGLLASANVMVGHDGYFKMLSGIASRVDAGALTIPDAARAVRAGFNHPIAAEAGARPRPELFAWASGTRDGRSHCAGAQLVAVPPGGMGGVTGVPLGLAIPFLQQLRGRVAGVFCPEDVVEPDAFFDRMAPYCQGHVAGRPIIYVSTEMLDG
jgi:saccharopine dehydrogenase-like NADP-dependent oxidoreductase